MPITVRFRAEGVNMPLQNSTGESIAGLSVLIDPSNGRFDPGSGAAKQIDLEGGKDFRSAVSAAKTSSPDKKHQLIYCCHIKYHMCISYMNHYKYHIAC